MVTAEEHGVRQRCFAAVLPEDDVVDVAVLRGTVTPRTHTGAVTGSDRSAQRRWDGPGSPSYVEDLRGTIGDDPRHRGIAPDQLGLCRGDRPHPRQLRRLDLYRRGCNGPASSEGGAVNDHRQVRAHPTDRCLVGVLEPLLTDIGQRVSTTLRPSADFISHRSPSGIG